MVVCFVCFCLIFKLCFLIVIFMYHYYCYVCYVLGVLFHCVVLCTVCVYMCTVLFVCTCVLYCLCVHVYCTVCVYMCTVLFVCTCVLYCLCVHVYCTTATGCQPSCSWQICQLYIKHVKFFTILSKDALFLAVNYFVSVWTATRIIPSSLCSMSSNIIHLSSSPYHLRSHVLISSDCSRSKLRCSSDGK
jgi:hypothetical protein